MKIIVGLGNPGEKYQFNRHNVGRMVIEKVQSAKFASYKWEKLGGAEICKAGEVILVKAGEGEFMNESGEWVKKIRDFYKAENQEVIVVYDDLDLGVGRVLVSNRGPKIHNGVNSVISAIGEGFVHVRCGVDDRDGDRSLPGVEYVLRDFPDIEGRDLLVGKAVEEVGKLI